MNLGGAANHWFFACLKHGIVITTLANIITNWNEISISSP